MLIKPGRNQARDTIPLPPPPPPTHTHLTDHHHHHTTTIPPPYHTTCHTTPLHHRPPPPHSIKPKPRIPSPHHPHSHTPPITATPPHHHTPHTTHHTPHNCHPTPPTNGRDQAQAKNTGPTDRWPPWKPRRTASAICQQQEVLAAAGAALNNPANRG